MISLDINPISVRDVQQKMGIIGEVTISNKVDFN